MKLWLLVIGCAAGVACSRHDREAQVEAEERTPRQLDPPPQSVRALPPHAIRADGVGPYRLGVSLEQIANQVPSGARNAQVEIADVVHLSVLHADDEAILIGGEPLGRASFIAVVGAKIARTESGIHVGSTRDELVRALGAPVVEPDRARDPRVVVAGSLRELRAVFDDHDRVIGLVVSAAPAASKDEGCVRPALDSDDALRARSRFGACLTAGGNVVTIDGDELTVRAVDSDKPLAPALAVPSLVFAAALRAPDGRDDIVVVERKDDAGSRIWFVTAYRLDGGRLVPTIPTTPVYRVTPPQARTIGADLRDLDLALELVAHADTIEVGGLLTTRSSAGLRDLVVLSPVQVPRRRAKSAPAEPPDAGITDAITRDAVH